MFLICCLLLSVIPAIQCSGTNLMLKKPAILSSRHSYRNKACNANDGKRTGPPSIATVKAPSFWLGDLEGVYKETSVTVTGPVIIPYHYQIQSAVIGVTISLSPCEKDKLTICGHWPSHLPPGSTHVFNCSHAGPVRYVKVWKSNGNLAVSEVELHGEPVSLTEIVYSVVRAKKVTRPKMSLTVASVIYCGAKCHENQQCVTYSYSPSEYPNCLLATDVTMTSEKKWVSYTVSKCYKLPKIGHTC